MAETSLNANPNKKLLFFAVVLALLILVTKRGLAGYGLSKQSGKG